MTGRFATLLAAVAAALALASPALADDSGAKPGDNIVVAQNTTDGSSLFKLAFDIRRIAGAVVDQTNAAVAYSSCADCKTTAIAIQILLVDGSPSTYTPSNVAVAINENCSSCQTFAAAYQFVVQTNGPVRFTKQGWREIQLIRKGLKALEDDNLSPAELDARLKDLMARLDTVLRTQLVPADQEGDEEHERGPPDRREQSETATRPTSTSTPTTTTPPTTTAAPTTSTTTTTTPTTTSAPTTGTTTTPPTTTSAPTTSTTTTTPTSTNGTTTTTP
jgi:putative peptide zinc metalloprotease protein